MLSRLKSISACSWLIAIGGLLRLAWLGTAPYWYDEACTVLFIRLPFDRMIMATAGDTHPPLYYAIMWVWIRMVGENEFTLRLPSAILSTLALWLFWRLTAEFHLPRPARLGALALLTFANFQVFYGQEARMYALLLCLLLWAVLAGLQRHWVQFGIAVAGLMWTHNYGLFYAFTVGLFILWRERHAWIKPVISLALAGASFIPWGIVLLGQMRTVASGYWIDPVTMGEFLMSILDLFWADSPLWLSTLAGLLLFGWLAWAVVRALRRRKAWPVLWFAFMPVVLTLVVSFAWKPVWLYRGLIGITPFLAILLVWPIMIQPRRRQLYAAVLIVPLLVGGLLNHYLNNPKVGPDSQIRTLITMLRSEWQPGDIIYLVNDGTVPALTVYAPDLARHIYEMPECPTEHTRGALSPATRAALGVQQIALDQLEYNHVWVVWVWGSTSSQCEVNRAQVLTSGKKPVSVFADDQLVTAQVYRWTKGESYILPRP